MPTNPQPPASGGRNQTALAGDRGREHAHFSAPSPTGMHPGVSNGRRHAPKTNTCANRSSRRLERALAGIEKHLEHHPHDGMSTTRAAIIKTQLASFSKRPVEPKVT